MLVATFIVFLFVRKKNIEILKNHLETFQKIFMCICLYDILWLLVKFNGYFLGKSSDKDNYVYFSKFVYILSIVNLCAKLMLFGSIYIQVSKMIIKGNRGGVGKGRLSHNLPRGTIRMA